MTKTLSGTTCTYNNAVTRIIYEIETEGEEIKGIKAVVNTETLSVEHSKLAQVLFTTKIDYFRGTLSSPLVPKRSGAPGYNEGSPLLVALNDGGN